MSKTQDSITDWTVKAVEGFDKIRVAQEKRLAEISEIEDLGKRYLELDKFEDEAKKAKEEYTNRIADEYASARQEKETIFKRENIKHFVGSIIMGFTSIGITAIVSMATVPTVVFTLMSIILLTTYAMNFAIFRAERSDYLETQMDTNKDKMKTALKKSNFSKKFDKLLDKVKSLKSSLLNDNIIQLATSSEFSNLYDNCPEVKKAFVRASVKQSVSAPQPSKRVVRHIALK